MRKIDVSTPKHPNTFAMVDDEDYERVAAYKWSAWAIGRNVYAARAIRIGNKRTILSMHRFILNAPPGIEGDHRDGNGLDNQRSNLRLATHAENQHNSRMQSNNTSGFKGVCFDKANKKWKAYIMVNGRNKHLGLFATPQDAHAAYARAAELYHGEFARAA